VDPGDALDQDRFAGPIVAGQGGDLAGGNIEIYVDERMNGAEALTDAPKPEKRLVGHLLDAGRRACRRHRADAQV
jgi:hypothetical protein